jgi:poly(A) polymerase
MDPIELLSLCREGARVGAPRDLIVPRLFSAGEFEDLWRRNPRQVRRILDETVTGDFPGDGLELLLRSGIIGTLFPELAAIKDLGDDPASAMHKDVWEHTKQVVAGVPAQVELRWAALMHDIGKSRTRRVTQNGKVTFHNHDVVGAKMVDKIEERLDLFRDNDSLFITVRMLVLNHLRPAGYKKSWTDSGVRRLLTDLGGMRNFERLMALSRADLTTKNPNKRDRALARGRELEERVKAVYAQDTSPKLPKGTMGIIIERKACPIGPGLNALRANLEHMMQTGELPCDKDAEWYATEGVRLYLVRHEKLTNEIQKQMQDVLTRNG